MSERSRPDSSWNKIKKWIAGLTGLLLVIPALINSGLDVYKALLALPRTDAEKANVELFKKHFGKTPIAAYPLPIRRDGVMYDVKLSVFDEGDLYVEYGKYTQWFPFPKMTPARASAWSPVQVAFAQDAPRLTGPYQQTEELRGNVLFRQRTYSNGAVESFTLDTRSGRVTEYSVKQQGPSGYSSLPPDSRSGSNTRGVDLDRPRSQNDLDAASKAAQHILTLLQGRQFERLWNEQVSEWFKSKMTKDVFISNLAIGRQRLGVTRESKLIDTTYSQVDTTTGFRGDIYMFSYRNSYDVGDFYERIVVVKDGDARFRLSGVWGQPVPQ